MDDRVGGLHEKDRWRAFRIVAHFAGVCGIIAANTINPVHRICLICPADGNNWLRYFKQIHA